MDVKKITSRKQGPSAVDFFLIPTVKCLGSHSIPPLLQYEFDTAKQEILDVLNLLSDYFKEEN